MNQLACKDTTNFAYMQIKTAKSSKFRRFDEFMTILYEITYTISCKISLTVGCGKTTCWNSAVV